MVRRRRRRLLVLLVVEMVFDRVRMVGRAGIVAVGVGVGVAVRCRVVPQRQILRRTVMLRSVAVVLMTVSSEPMFVRGEVQWHPQRLQHQTRTRDDCEQSLGVAGLEEGAHRGVTLGRQA